MRIFRTKSTFDRADIRLFCLIGRQPGDKLGESVYQPDDVDCDLTWTAMPTSLYIGIDLGTTFTGVVYACPPSRTIHTISEWPGTDNNEAKVPTRLFYDNDKLVGWGFAHPGHDTKGNKGRGQEISVVERFKLAIGLGLGLGFQLLGRMRHVCRS
jgi:hypothetical protein